MPYPSPSLFPPFYPGTAPNDDTPPPDGPPPGQWAGSSGDVYTLAIRSVYALWYSVDAYAGGVPVPGATDMRPTGGSVTDTTKPGVRRLLSLELTATDELPTQALFERLAPTGTELRVTAHVQFTNRTVQTLPMGWFDVDSQSIREGSGELSLTAPDRFERVKRARFIRPRSVPKGRRVVDEITSMIRGALGGDTEVIDLSGSQAKCAAQTFERDRDQAILTLAQSAGLWVFFDRDGVATIRRQPTGNSAPRWRADTSENGVLLSLDRERSRTVTRNVVVVESSAADTPAFPTQTVWDANPASPTYAGTNPVTAPGSAGPFGIVPYFHDTPLPLTATEARATALSILARTIGLASQVSLEQTHNPAVDAWDVVEVLPPRERYDVPRVLERHVVDTVTHPLVIGGTQRIEGRSTRSDAYTSEG